MCVGNGVVLVVVGLAWQQLPANAVSGLLIVSSVCMGGWEGGCGLGSPRCMLLAACCGPSRPHLEGPGGKGEGRGGEGRSQVRGTVNTKAEAPTCHTHHITRCVLCSEQFGTGPPACRLQPDSHAPLLLAPVPSPWSPNPTPHAMLAPCRPSLPPPPRAYASQTNT